MDSKFIGPASQSEVNYIIFSQFHNSFIIKFILLIKIVVQDDSFLIIRFSDNNNKK